MDNKRQLTVKENNFCKELAWYRDTMQDGFKRQVFRRIFMGFYQYKTGQRATKCVTKAEILEHLAREGLVKLRKDGSLPDDRKVREAARELLKQGLPVLSTSNNKGYFIAEYPYEIDKPQRENQERATAIYAVNKGYDKARAMLMGQGRIFG